VFFGEKPSHPGLYERERKMRIAIITTHPPGQGSLNEYAYHFVRFLRHKPEVSEIILLPDELPPGQQYEFTTLQPNHTDNAHGQSYTSVPSHTAPVRVIPCWRFGAWNNTLRILKAIRQTRPDVVLFNLQFATFGGRKIPATLGLLAPALTKFSGFPAVILLHNIIETVDLKSAGFGTNPLIETLIRFFGRIVTRLLLSANLVAVTIPKYVDILTADYIFAGGSPSWTTARSSRRAPRKRSSCSTRPSRRPHACTAISRTYFSG
jgi:hypothetical protein